MPSSISPPCSRHCSSIITWRSSAAALLLLAFAACSPETKFRSTDITGADYGRRLDLTDAAGRPRHLEDFRGKAVVLFFGYTHCPDVCPTTLAQTAQAMKALGPEADKVQVLFVTVDPERDTPEVLGKYVTAFDPRFLGLYGDADATRRAAKEFKIFYEKGSNGTVDHSSQTYVLDPQGRLRLLVRPERLAEDLPADLRTLLGGS
ncbi:MAG TPA: SCO family protein [Burkholderiales bacterium]|nr:SCO family protein [Burkholderiales bacterium]